jgi:3-phosphoshikimate 1-carboxyvinyltransferase
VVTLVNPGLKLRGNIHLPASKDISNQLLVLSFLSSSGLQVRNLSHDDETLRLGALLDRIQRHVNTNQREVLELEAGNDTTILCFLTACLSLTRGSFILTGSEGMQEQPIGSLVDALRQLGARIDYHGQKGYTPIRIEGQSFEGGELRIDASTANQFLCALLLIAPFLSDGLILKLEGGPASGEDPGMTLQILEKAGIPSVWNANTIHVFNKPITRKIFNVEPDWSMTALWYGMAALSEESDLAFHGLKGHSVQQDSKAALIYEKLGVETEYLQEGIRLMRSGNPVREFQYDFRDHPNLALPVIVTCAALGIKGHFEGLEYLRSGNQDILNDFHAELRKLRVASTLISPGILELERGKPIFRHKVTLPDSGDPRVSLSFLILALQGTKIRLHEYEYVNKYYPGFWDDLKNVGFRPIRPVYSFLSKGR